MKLENGMFKVLVLAMCAAAGLLVLGCRTPAVVEYDKELTKAREALTDGRQQAADRSLVNALAIATEHNLDVSETSLLRAEMAIRAGNAETAVSIAREVLAVDQDNARANEVCGKALLTGGRFAEAEPHLVAAQSAYPTACDRGRAADLIALTRGLQAYGRGDLAVAQKYWAGINDDDLRYVVDIAAKRAAE